MLFYKEAFEECPILAKYKEGDNFNHRNTLDISRIEIWAWRSNRAKEGIIQRSLQSLLIWGRNGFDGDKEA